MTKPKGNKVDSIEVKVGLVKLKDARDHLDTRERHGSNPLVLATLTGFTEKAEELLKSKGVSCVVLDIEEIEKWKNKDKKGD